jgi:hypothetical protein
MDLTSCEFVQHRLHCVHSFPGPIADITLDYLNDFEWLKFTWENLPRSAIVRTPILLNDMDKGQIYSRHRLPETQIEFDKLYDYKTKPIGIPVLFTEYRFHLGEMKLLYEGKEYVFESVHYNPWWEFIEFDGTFGSRTEVPLKKQDILKFFRHYFDQGYRNYCLVMCFVRMM